MAIIDAIAIACAILALFFFLASSGSFREHHWVLGVVTLLLGSTLFVAGLLFGAIAVGTQGYRALTGEDVAVTVTTERISSDSIRAKFTFPGGISRTYRIAGDAIQLEAHVLRWGPLVTRLGPDTQYELDRVSGSYSRPIDQETKPRTVLSLAVRKPLDFFDLATRFTFFDPLLAHEHREASFVPGGSSQTFEVRVSESELLVQRAGG
jgi:hypothetical protein